ncbi:MAG: AsmA family protein, partial [Nitrospirota bacterium]|nr:AsmA family protein [Nitrospirota bacterium]
FKNGTQDVRITLKDQKDEGKPFLNVTQAALSSRGGGPLLFSAEGSLKEKPFTITSSSGGLNQLIKGIHQWPLSIAVEFPQLSIDLKGHLLFPINSENFSFQVLVKGESWKDAPFLTETEFPDLGPFKLTGQLTQIKEGYRVTELKGQWGPNDMAGDLTFMTNVPRPKLVATLRSETNEFSFLTKTLSPPTDPEEGTILMNIVGSVAKIGAGAGRAIAGIGSQAGDAVTKSLGFEKTDDGNETRVPRIIPDFEFPVAMLRSIDLDLDWQIQKVESKGTHLGNLSYNLTLEDGLLTIGPLTGTMWHGAINSRIELDASQYVPTLTAQLTIQGLDVGFLDDTVGVTDLVKGEIDLIKLNLKSRGTTFHEVLNRANGEAEFVEGPFELTNDYMDAWAADIFTFTLTKAWKKEEVTKLNCMVGYFDIKEGEIQSDAILFDTQKITVGGFGTFNLGSEQIDLILTPQPKTPTLATLAHPVRIHGHLSDPEVTNDKLRIAQGGGWYLLGLVSPIGLTIVIPKMAGTTIGTGKENPCVDAMSGKAFTVQEVSELQEGFWDWMARKMKGVFTSNGDSKKPPPISESGKP